MTRTLRCDQLFHMIIDPQQGSNIPSLLLHTVMGAQLSYSFFLFWKVPEKASDLPRKIQFFLMLPSLLEK